MWWEDSEFGGVKSGLGEERNDFRLGRGEREVLHQDPTSLASGNDPLHGHTGTEGDLGRREDHFLDGCGCLLGGLLGLLLGGLLQAKFFRCSRLETWVLARHRTALCSEEHTSRSWVKRQFGPSGQLPFSHSWQCGLNRGSTWGRSL